MTVRHQIPRHIAVRPAPPTVENRTESDRPPTGARLSDTHHGAFWLVTDPEQRVNGDLDLAGRFPTLRLDGALTPWLKPGSTITSPDGTTTTRLSPAPAGPDHESHLIHGHVGLTIPVTVGDAFTRRRQGLALLGGKEEQTLSGAWGVYGAHVTAETRYVAARVQLRHLPAWARLPSLSWQTDGTTLSAMSKLSHPAPVPVPSLGAAATVRLRSTHGVVDHADRPAVTLHHDRSIVVDHIDPLTLDELLRRVVAPLSALLTLAIDAAAPVVALDVRVDGGEPVAPEVEEAGWLPVAHPIVRRDEAPHVPDNLHIASFGDIGVAGMAAWLDVAPSLDVIPTLVTEQIGMPDSTIETQLFVLASAAEGLHRRTHDTEFRLSAEQAKAARGVIKAAQDLDQDTRDIAVEVMGHMREPTYAQRLRALAAEVAEAVPGVTGDLDAWVKRVKEHRNAFAHRLTEDTDDDDDSFTNFGELLALTQSLRWLLGALLLRRAGVDDVTLAQRHAEHPRYSHFIHSAPVRAPGIWTRPATTET